MPSLYRRESSDPKSDAQRNLAGRTHYVNDDTLRYFRSRILSSHVVDSGLIFAITESASADHQHKSRIFRYSIFDVFGNVVDRPEIEHSWKSSQPAIKAMWRKLEEINAVQVTRDAIERRRESFEFEMRELTIKVDTLSSDTKAA